MARMRRQPYVAFFVRGHQIAPQKQKAPFRRTEGVASKTYNTPSCGFLKTDVMRRVLQKRANLCRHTAWYNACMRDVAGFAAEIPLPLGALPATRRNEINRERAKNGH
jgi:hypothetical protein